MYVSIRRYTVGAGSSDALAHRLEEEFAPAISQEPGFLGYLAIGTDDGTLEAVSVFVDARSAHRSDELAHDYVSEHLTEFRLGPVTVSGGEVLASRMTPAILEAAHRWRLARVRARETARSAPVLVVGASGRTGRQIVGRLLERRIPVHALVRDAARGRSVLPAVTDLFVGDVRRRETLAPALEGVQTLIVASSGGGRPDDSPVVVDYFGTQHLVNEAAAAGVGLVVFISSIHATRPDHYQDVEPTSLGWKARAEEVVRASGLPYCIVRAGWLTDGPGGEPLALSQGDVGEGHLARSDLADVCAELLDIEGARGKTFEVVARRGGERRALEDMIAELAPDGAAAVGR